VCKEAQKQVQCGDFPLFRGHWGVVGRAHSAWALRAEVYGGRALMGRTMKHSVSLRLNPLHLVARPCNSVYGAHRAFAGGLPASLTPKPQVSKQVFAEWPRPGPVLKVGLARKKITLVRTCVCVCMCVCVHVCVRVCVCACGATNRPPQVT